MAIGTLQQSGSIKREPPRPPRKMALPTAARCAARPGFHAHHPAARLPERPQPSFSSDRVRARLRRGTQCLPPAAALRASVPVSPAHSGAEASRTPSPAPPAPRVLPPPSSTRSRRPPRTRDFRGWLLSDRGRGRSHSATTPSGVGGAESY